MDSVISADGTRIAYQRVGQGLPLVLVHGTLDDHTIWAPLLPALGEHFTVYALDRRGRGGSIATNGAPYAIEREVEDVAAVVKVAGEPAHLLGHSYGALCSLEAARHIANLRKLVLDEPPIPIPPGTPIGPPEAPEKVEIQLAAGDREGAVLTFAREIAQVPEEAIAAFRSSPDWQRTLDAAPTLVDEIRAVKGYAFDPARFRGLPTPTLLLLGSESPPYMKVATEAVASALPHHRLTVLAGQGHLAMFSAPELFLSEVIQFLTEG